MANILIVGADQGIGYYLVERLLEVGNSVTVLDRQTEHVEMRMHVMLPVLRTVYAGRWNSLALSISRYTMPVCARLRMSATPAVKSIKK